jgi:hypothetical protein
LFLKKAFFLYLQKVPTNHSHGHGDGHEAEGGEDNDVPVLAMMNKFV